MIYCVISKQGCLLGVFSCYQDAHIVAKRQGATVQQCSLNSECGIDAPVCSSIAVSHAADHRGAVPNTIVRHIVPGPGSVDCPVQAICAQDRRDLGPDR